MTESDSPGRKAQHANVAWTLDPAPVPRWDAGCRSRVSPVWIERKGGRPAPSGGVVSKLADPSGSEESPLGQGAWTF
ncbi:hypothetical protein GCM10010211_00690 [Streptomyces albospinus]|uniref:Uncharacterized protein n=1 Tax=Streptomyces albospinus TaxID=285515 RepID=A0ABQ2ULX3_9ACTN|nr:hypothetical protein GCM10010211_00690 [Streptomyces albospinus]